VQSTSSRRLLTWIKITLFSGQTAAQPRLESVTGMAHSRMQNRYVCLRRSLRFNLTTELRHLPFHFQCVKVNPTWAKGYARKGAALHGQRRYVEAIETYEVGLKIEDSPALRKGLDEVKAAKGALFDFLPQAPFLPLDPDSRTRDHAAADERGDGAEALGIGKMFSDPGMFAKLAANPRTAKHLADASFMQKVCTLHFEFSPPPSRAYSSSSSNSYSRIPNWRRPCSTAIRA
jgi:hypothetical protein